MDWSLGAVRRCAAGKRGAFLHARLVAAGRGGVRVRRLGGDRAGEIRLTRFLRNPMVRPDEMLETAQSRLGAGLAGRHVPAIQDTTVTRSDRCTGSDLHAMVAVDATDGALPGLVDAAFLHREAARPGPRTQMTDDKAGFVWIGSVV